MQPSAAFRYLLSSLLLASAWLSLQANERMPSDHRAAQAGVRLREGSKISDLLGRFELVGDQTTFTPTEGGESFRLLENLALERINQILNDSRDKAQWQVSGVVTEYRGTNYLMVTKALIKAQTTSAPGSAARPSK